MKKVLRELNKLSVEKLQAILADDSAEFPSKIHAFLKNINSEMQGLPGEGADDYAPRIEELLPNDLGEYPVDILNRVELVYQILKKHDREMDADGYMVSTLELILTAKIKQLNENKLKMIEARRQHAIDQLLAECRKYQEHLRKQIKNDYPALLAEDKKLAKQDKKTLASNLPSNFSISGLNAVMQDLKESNSPTVVRVREAEDKLKAVTDMGKVLSSSQLSSQDKLSQFAQMFKQSKGSISEAREDTAGKTFLRVVATILACVSVVGFAFLPLLWKPKGERVAEKIEKTLKRQPR